MYTLTMLTGDLDDTCAPAIAFKGMEFVDIQSVILTLDNHAPADIKFLITPESEDESGSSGWVEV